MKEKEKKKKNLVCIWIMYMPMSTYILLLLHVLQFHVYITEKYFQFDELGGSKAGTYGQPQLPIRFDKSKKTMCAYGDLGLLSLPLSRLFSATNSTPVGVTGCGSDMI